MAAPDISVQRPSFKAGLKNHPTAFEVWARCRGYDIGPAVVPSDIRQYADRETQAAFDAWNAGAQSVARMLTESSIYTEAPRRFVVANLSM